jgi:hypothetical protein
MSFFVDVDGKDRNRDVLFRTQRFSKSLYDALDQVTGPNLHRALGEEMETPYEILTPAEIAAVVARRQLVRQYMDALITQYGSRNVLAFP